MQSVICRVLVSSVFLNAAHIIFEKKKLNLRAPVYWDAARTEFLGGLFVTLRWLQKLKIDIPWILKDEWENFRKYQATYSWRPEASNEQLRKATKLKKGICFYFLLYVTEILDLHLFWHSRQNFAPSRDTVFKKSVVVFKLAQFSSFMGWTALKIRFWKCGNLLQ